MIDPSFPNPAFYSETNDNSGFRFVRLSNHRHNPTLTLENRCSLCGSVQIDDGHAVTFQHPSGIPSIYCGDCHAQDLGAVHCGSCKDELADDDIYDIFEVPDDFDLPRSMEHYDAICNDCMDDTPDNDPFDINYVQEDDMNRTDDTIKRIEDKIDQITDYLQGRKALYEDYYNDDITEEELNAALKRMWIGLQSRINQAD